MDYKVTLGSAENGKELVWSVRTNPHAYLSGKSGSGKSYKLRELIAQLPGQGIRCIVCDCSNDLSFALKEGFGANLPLDVLDLRSGEFSMNPLESMQLTEEEWESAVDISSRFAETLRAAYHLHDAQMVYLSEGIPDVRPDAKIYPRADFLYPVRSGAVETNTDRSVSPGESSWYRSLWRVQLRLEQTAQQSRHHCHQI